MRGIAFVVNLFMVIAGLAQEPSNFKFGQVGVEDFKIESKLINASTSAVVIADFGEVSFEDSALKDFALVFKRVKRIKIIDKNAFYLADLKIILQKSKGLEEKLINLKAFSYNVEKGEVVKTAFDSTSIFEEKTIDKQVIKKCTLSGVKVGSIIEFTYTIHSPFIFKLPSWEFQGEYPCLWSSYNINVPEFLKYVIVSQEQIPYTFKKETLYKKRYYSFGNDLYNTYEINGKRVTFFGREFKIQELNWVIKDVPAMKKESFTTTIENYIAKLDFQLAEYAFPNLPLTQILHTWPKVSEELMEDDYFGKTYNKSNAWLTDDIRQLANNAASPLEKTHKIYAFVRDNFTCTDNYAIKVNTNSSLKEVFKRKSGSVAELNLLLLAMLRHENISSDPVILSLRHRGWVNATYPLMDRFNYLVCQAKIDGKTYYLDASHAKLGFNFLPGSCYNGTAWVIADKKPYSVSFDADSLKEYKLTTVFLNNSETKEWEGVYQSQHGMNESLEIRETIANTSKEAFSKEIKKNFINDVEIQNLIFDSLQNYDEPVSVKFDFKIKTGDNVLYVNPMFGEQIAKNPFVSETRSYPIELPYTTNETYVLMMETPKGYAIEEMPKSAKFELNEGEGLFEYKCSKTEDGIQIRTKLKLNKANFETEDYSYLRDFFAQVIKKQQEQIVYRKLK